MPKLPEKVYVPLVAILKTSDFEFDAKNRSPSEYLLECFQDYLDELADSEKLNVQVTGGPSFKEPESKEELNCEEFDKVVEASQAPRKFFVYGTVEKSMCVEVVATSEAEAIRAAEESTEGFTAGTGPDCVSDEEDQG